MSPVSRAWYLGNMLNAESGSSSYSIEIRGVVFSTPVHMEDKAQRPRLASASTCLPHTKRHLCTHQTRSIREACMSRRYLLGLGACLYGPRAFIWTT